MDEMIPGDDDDMDLLNDADAIRHEATAARLGFTPLEDLSPEGRDRHKQFSGPPPATQDVRALIPGWSLPETPAEILERTKEDRSAYGSPEYTQVVLQVAILETLLSIEKKLGNGGRPGLDG